MAVPPLGPLVRLHGLSVAQLPSHDQLPTTTSSAPDLTTFIQQVLAEGLAFIDSLPRATGASSPTPLWRPLPAKHHAHTPIHMFRRDVSRTDLPTAPAAHAGETWFARISTHADSSTAGTASLAEFDLRLRNEHAVNEQRFCHLRDAHRALAWDAAPQIEGLVPGKTQIGVYEMVHGMPFPLRDRVFVELVVSAQLVDGAQLLVVSVPLADPLALPGVKYVGKGGVVVGRYAAVNRVRAVEGGNEWAMVVASNAGGALPLAVLRSAMPAAIAKDVGLFMEYVESERPVV